MMSRIRNSVLNLSGVWGGGWKLQQQQQKLKIGLLVSSIFTFHLYFILIFFHILLQGRKARAEWNWFPTFTDIQIAMAWSAGILREFHHCWQIMGSHLHSLSKTVTPFYHGNVVLPSYQIVHNWEGGESLFSYIDCANIYS